MSHHKLIMFDDINNSKIRRTLIFAVELFIYFIDLEIFIISILLVIISMSTRIYKIRIFSEYIVITSELGISYQVKNKECIFYYCKNFFMLLAVKYKYIPVLSAANFFKDDDKDNLEDFLFDVFKKKPIT